MISSDVPLPDGKVLMNFAACLLRSVVCLLAAGAGICLSLTGNLLSADEPAAARPDSSVISLFDGKTLTGWKVIEYAGDGGAEVKDGHLRIKQGEPITSIIWKGQELPRINYEISMEARRVDGSDFFATLTFPVQDKYCSLVTGGWGGGVIGLSNINGADASENETTDFLDFEKDRWYKIRVRVTETHVQAWIDEKQVADVDHTENLLSVRIEMELCKPLGLSSYLTTGEIKDLQLRRLPAGKAPQETSAK